MKKVIALLSGFTLLLHTIPSVTMASPPAKSFVELCEQKQAGTKIMLGELLKIAGTKDCKKANVKLKTIT